MSTNHTSAQSTQGWQRVDRVPLVDSEVAKHVARIEDPSLITVTHTPNAITTHLVASESDDAPVVRMEQGHVVTKHVTEDYGTLLAVVGGPAVVEIGLHYDVEQRDRYLTAVKVVDQEAAATVTSAVQAAAMAIVQSLGVVVEDEEPNDASDEEAT